MDETRQKSREAVGSTGLLKSETSPERGETRIGRVLTSSVVRLRLLRSWPECDGGARLVFTGAVAAEW